MASKANEQLVKYLTDAHAMEQQAVRLLEKGSRIAGDEGIAAIYRAHLMQTQEHERYVRERLEAHGATPSNLKDLAAKGGALAIGIGAQAAPDTPVKLALAAFAFEHFEIASYRLLRRLAKRAGDQDTVSVVERILEQEEAAAELVEGTFDRALELTLGEPPTSPLVPVTPLGKPSDRPADQRPELQDQTRPLPDEPIGQPPHVETPTEGEHLGSPGPGHPAGETEPIGGVPKRAHEHPEEVPPPPG